MYVERVLIKRFRLFEDLELVLNPGLNVVVGENDSGKSSLIDAVRIVLGSHSDNYFISEADFYNDSDSFEIQLKFTNVEKHAYRFVEHLSHEIIEDESGNKVKKNVLYVQLTAKKTGKERRGYPHIQRVFRSGHDGNGLSLESDIRDFLATTYLKPLRDAEAELSSGRNSRLSQILNSSKEIRGKKDDILDIVATANDELLKPGSPLQNSADNICKNYLHKLIFDSDKPDLGVFIDIAGVRSNIIPYMSDSDKHRHLRTILEGLSLALTGDGKLHGLGYHNILFMATELLLLEQEVENEFPLLLIEEPEAHLHPQLQMKLLQFINQKVRKSIDSKGIQCLMTTLSPNLSSKADPSDIILLRNGKAWPLRFELTELQEKSYVFLRKFLDATKANVFFARGLLFVEGDSENILLPVLAELLGRPLEDYGVSIIKYDNSGSWKRFAELFLRKGKDDDEEAWIDVKICVLRDLDLWPDCAQEKDSNNNNGSDGNDSDGNDSDGEKIENRYGFKVLTRGNKKYWRKNCKDEKEWRKKLIGNYQRQNVKILISDDWTFEYCLAKGNPKGNLFKECYEAVNGSINEIEDIKGSPEEKATYIQSKVSKTDFAYNLARILERNLNDLTKDLSVSNSEKSDEEVRELAKSIYASKLKEVLPDYIVKSIENVTAPITEVNNPYSGVNVNEKRDEDDETE